MTKDTGVSGGPLRNLARLRDATSRRASSYDRDRGNHDYVWVSPGEAVVLLDEQGAGCITHIWMTSGSDDSDHLRKAAVRMWWDGERDPSVDVPLGDFFGLGHARSANFASLPLVMSPQGGRGMTSYFPMPFSDRGHIQVSNDASEPLRLYYYIDYEMFEYLDPSMGRFHATWNRVNPLPGEDPGGWDFEDYQFSGRNDEGANNFVLLDAEGKGHYVGCHLDIRNLTVTRGRNWYGEGDDMIFVDGEPYPPSIHGTGTEDYFNLAWCPQEKFASPYFGLTLPGGPNWSGEVSLYRFHVEDPIHFAESIRVTIEHGHANRRMDDYSSTAYWYQAEPHKPLPPLPPVEHRVPSGGAANSS